MLQQQQFSAGELERLFVHHDTGVTLVNKGQFIAKTMQEQPEMAAPMVYEAMLAAGYITTLASVQSGISRFRKSGMLTPSGAAPGAPTNGTKLPAMPVFVNGLRIEKSVSATEKVHGENYVQRYKVIRDRYQSFEALSEQVCLGTFPSLIVSGPPGLGKSFIVKKVVRKLGLRETHEGGAEFAADDAEATNTRQQTVSWISGTIRGPGLYMQLWEQRNGGVIVLDDSDDIFRDETALNLLKSVLDSKDQRIVSYHKLARFLEENDIPQSFEFKGSIIFCTNIDMEAEMGKNNILSPHFHALMDRSLYLHLAMRNQHDYFVRVNQVIEEGLFTELKLEKKEIKEVIAYVKKNMENFYLLSLRLVYYIGVMRKKRPNTWKHDVQITKMRTIKL